MAEKTFKFVCQTELTVKQDPVDWAKCCVCQEDKQEHLQELTVKQDPVDWAKCCVYQEDKQEHLQDPSLYKGSSPGSGYATLAGNIRRFKTINSKHEVEK